MMVLAFSVFLPDTGGAIAARWLCCSTACCGAILIAISVMGSAACSIGSSRIAHPNARRHSRSTGAFAEIFDAFRGTGLRHLRAGSLAAYVGQGMTFSITQYVNLYVWQFDRDGFPVLSRHAVLIGGGRCSCWSRRCTPLGKARYRLAHGACGAAFYFIPYVLYLADVWPIPGTFASTAAIYVSYYLANTSQRHRADFSATSMVAEIVEAFEERTDKRAEGTFFSGNWLVQKCATGGGILLTSFIVGQAGIAPGTRRSRRRRCRADHRAAVSGLRRRPGGHCSILAGRFPITREQHEARLARRGSAAGVPPIEKPEPLA